MLYDNYRKKMNKLKNVLDIIKRFRVLIIIVCAALVALIVTLMSVSGIVYDKTDCPATLTYGEDLSYRAKAVFKSVRYEYAEENSDKWTDTKPVRAGSYKVRPVSKDVFGGTRYGKTHSFEILKRQTDISAAAQTVYGDNPEVVLNLAYSDAAVCTSFIFEDLTQRTTSVIPEVSGIKIIDKDGADVTSSYILNPVQTQITFLPRPITVKADGAQKVYDGEPLMCDTYSTENLLSGHILTATTQGSQTDARIQGVNSIVEGSVKITTADGVDLTHNYYVMTESGTLEVKPRPFKITTGSAEDVYDGKALTCDTYSAENLLSGHTLGVVFTGAQTNAGKSANTVTNIKITAADGEDVTANYDLENIEYNLGTLTINKRTLTITATDARKIYDGTAQESTAHTAQNLVAGHSTQGHASVSLTEVGTVKNRVTVTVYSGGTEVTENYEINYIDGYFTVAPRPITVTAGSLKEEYDGKAHACGKFEVTSALGFALVSGHKVNAATQGSQTEIGKAANRIVAGSISVTDANGKAVTGNYEINIADGEIEITARAITVKADDAKKIYDGTALTCVTYTDKDGKLLAGHTLSATTQGSQTNAGKSANAIVAGSVKITAAGGADVTANYSVTVEQGTLEVAPRPIKITMGSATKVYDGTPLTCNDFTITADYSPALVLSHEAKGIAVAELTEVGTIKNSVIVQIFDGETDVTANYKKEYTDGGTLTVTHRPITVRTQGGEWVYDGGDHYNKQIIISGDGIADGQSYSLNYYTIIVDAGELENQVGISIYDGEGNETTKNYSITYAEPLGVLKVTKRPLTIRADSVEKVYDGTPLQNIGALVDNLIYGHVLDFRSGGSQTDVGTSKSYIAWYRISDASGYDVTDNYEVTLKEGTLSVTARAVTIYAQSASKVYDGTPLTCPYTAWSNGLATHTVRATVTGSQTEVGSSVNTISNVAIYNGSRDVTFNFDIATQNGTLTVTHGTLIVYTGSAQKPYDGTPLTCPMYYVDGNSQIPDGYTYTVTVTGTITAVGSKRNTADIEIFDADGIDVTENFGIEKHLGTLLITDGSEGGGDIGGGGGLDGSGGIGGANGETGGGSGKATIMMRLYSDATGSAYLRYKSFGDYNGKKWSEAQSYTQLLDGGYSANYLTSLALENSGMQTHTMQILPFTYDYTLPYYTAAVGGNYDVQSSDIAYYGNTGAQYSLNYFLYDYTAQSSAQTVPAQYSAYEAAYRQFVYENYLDVPTTTREYLSAVITGQRFNKNDAQIIAKVARYVQRSAQYNLNYNSALDSSSDIVVAFLRDYKQGICSHYASAATLLYRTLGMPARYVIGYKGATVAGEWTEVTAEQAHAWVEVYIDGTGWVQVEVTGGSGGNQGGGNQGGEAGETGGSGQDILSDTTIVLRPKNEAKAYDGTPVYAKELVPDAVLEKLLEMGYTYTVTFYGSLSGIGSVASSVETFSLFDADGKDVTDKFNYKYQNGKLTVAYGVITVCLYNLSKEYDGTPLRYSSCEYYTLGLPHGYTVSFDPSGVGRTDAGVIYSDDLGKANVYVFNAYGANVTSQYYIHFDGALVITQRTLKLTSNSDEKVYDGEALTNDGYYISGGSLVAGHSVQASVIGSVTDIGEAPNLFLSAAILDGSGNDVSLNYFCIGYLGTLKVLPD